MKRALLLCLVLAAALSLGACSCCKHKGMQGKKEGCKMHSADGHEFHGKHAAKEGAPVKLLPAAEALVNPAEGHGAHGGH